MLKILGALLMVCDHVGMLLFPDIRFLRIIGRLAFPIFAFLIAEGCRYTKNKLRYLFTMLGCAIVCQTVYFSYGNSLEMCVFVTFSLAIINVYAFELVKKALFSDTNAFVEKISIILFCSTLAFTYYLNTVLDIDYGFFGCILPVFTSIFYSVDKSKIGATSSLDKIPVHVLTTAIGLILLIIERGGSTQIYCLLAIPILMLYSGERGRLRLKYFFYVFYPAHLVVLEMIAVLLSRTK